VKLGNCKAVSWSSPARNPEYRPGGAHAETDRALKRDHLTFIFNFIDELRIAPASK
jgi:hypothetical protein